MAIKVSSKKCFTASQKRSWQKLANYVTSHYPKDSDLHKAVRGTFKAIDDAAKKLGKASKKHAKPKRRAIKRTTPKHRKVKRSPAKHRTAKRALRGMLKRMGSTDLPAEYDADGVQQPTMLAFGELAIEFIETVHKVMHDETRQYARDAVVKAFIE